MARFLGQVIFAFLLDFIHHVISRAFSGVSSFNSNDRFLFFKAEPEKKVSKAGSAASSPAMSKWRKAIHQMTPEIMRQARTKRLQKEQKLLKDPVAIKAQLSKTRTTSLYRPVAASSLTKPTAASVGKAAAAAVPAVPAAKPMAASRPLAPTQPVPFSFDIDRRNKTSKEPVKGTQ